MAESTRIQVRIYAQAKQFNCAKAWYETKKMRIQWGHATKVHVCANKRSRKKKKKKIPFFKTVYKTLFSNTKQPRIVQMPRIVQRRTEKGEAGTQNKN
ncbi:hypothetical protein POVWA2_008710 [Plasmodium ovale wallikeri]|uniref:Uncharacterized protein n=1 Tax=Plasmodium ovale wallikeri TaxID=864142 RepID=A0A1A8YL38_PLAOA|nr:hypothetical protein POVWA2_008710 [Plasmodium ovale wallikeri]